MAHSLRLQPSLASTQSFTRIRTPLASNYSSQYLKFPSRPWSYLRTVHPTSSPTHMSTSTRPLQASPLLRVRRQLRPALYGQVLECELLGHDNPVAVKCISLSRAAEARRQVQSIREIDNPVQEQHVAALLVANGGHRNVVQPHFHFVHDRRLYLVNELCGDGDLHSLLESRLSASSLPREEEVLPLMRQVLEGVHYLHTTLSIAHRDLSLENVLLSRGVCKITDFGLSTDAQTVCEGGRVGKEFYMAPEVVAGERYNPALADVWSLGIMWFIMLTGSPLLPLASPSERGFEAVQAHGVGTVIKVWGHSGRISKASIALLDKMLQIDPTRRISLDQVLAHPMFGSISRAVESK